LAKLEEKVEWHFFPNTVYIRGELAYAPPILPTPVAEFYAAVQRAAIK